MKRLYMTKKPEVKTSFGGELLDMILWWFGLVRKKHYLDVCDRYALMVEDMIDSENSA